MQSILAADVAFQEIVDDLTDSEHIIPLTSVLPSTTAVALPTLWTAHLPGQHGMLGTMMFLREVGILTNMLHFRPIVAKDAFGILNKWGMKWNEFVSVPSLGEQLIEVGVPTHLILHDELLGTGLSRILHRGIQNTYPHVSTNDVWLRLRDVMNKTVGQRCFVTAYVPTVDVLSHIYGVDNIYTHNEIKKQLSALRDILLDDNVEDGRTLVMLIADHGHYDTRHMINFENDCLPIHNAMRFGFGGDRRFSQIYVRDGHKQTIMDLLDNDFADRLAYIDVEDAIRAGLFGYDNLHSDIYYRLGDLIIISRLGFSLADSIRKNKKTLVSIHGGMSDWEMLVPLIWRVI